MKLFILVLLAHGLGQCAPARAYTLRYRVSKPDAAAILQRVEAATGLDFAAKCSTCTVHGHINTGGGEVIVEVYQTKVSPRTIATPKVSAALKKAIGKAVLGR